MPQRDPPTGNAFQLRMPGTQARDAAQARIEQLRQRGGVFVQAVRATRMPMVLTDPGLPGNPIIFANQSVLDLSGYGMDDVLGQEPHFMNGPDTDPRDADRFRQILENDQDGVVESVQYAKGGRRFVAMVLLSAFKDDTGRTVHHFLSWADVTRRVDAEAELDALQRTQDALRESEAKYRVLFDSIDEGLAIVEMVDDGQGNCVDMVYRQVNAAFERHTGLRVAVGRPVSEMLPGIGQVWLERHSQVARTGQPLRLQDHQPERDGWLDVRISRVDPLGRLTAVVVQNITARKRAEEELRGREDRQAFLLDFSDALRAEADEDAVAKRAVQLLCGHMGLDRCYITFYRPADDAADFVYQVGNASVPPLPASVRLSDFPRAYEQVRERTFVMEDDLERQDVSDAERAGTSALGMRAMVASTARKAEKTPLSSLVAVSSRPRRWSSGEIALVEEAAERTWAAMGRARAEKELRKSEERLRRFGDASQDILWIREVDTLQWSYLTPAFEAIYGLPRSRALAGDHYRSWMDLIVPEDREQAAAHVRRVRQGEHATFDYRIRRPADGQVRWLRNTDFPLADENGVVTSIGGIGHDLTELREAELRLHTLVQGIPQLVWRAADGGRWTWASPQWERYTGLGAADSMDLGWLQALHPDDRPRACEAWDHAARTGGFEVEYRLRDAATQDYHWFQTRATLVRDAAGAVVEWLGTSTDIHDLRDLQERQRVLVAELQHRTRNLMGVIRSITDSTARSARSLPEFLGRLRDRLDAMARVQGLLSRLNEHDRVTFDELVHTEFAAMQGVTDKVSLQGPAGIRLRSSTVQTLAMALHELATNAVKYGALRQPSGQLSVTWSFEPSGPGGKPWLHMDWRERGVAMPPAGSPPVGSGHGRELIEQALPYQLQARTAYALGPDGVHCTISVPVSASPAPPAGPA